MNWEGLGVKGRGLDLNEQASRAYGSASCVGGLECKR